MKDETHYENPAKACFLANGRWVKLEWRSIVITCLLAAISCLEGVGDGAKTVDAPQILAVCIQDNPCVLIYANIMKCDLAFRLVTDWPPAFAEIKFDPHFSAVFDFNLRPGNAHWAYPVTPATVNYLMHAL